MRALVFLTATLLATPVAAQNAVLETRDPRQQQDPDFARAYAQWTTEPRYGSPLVDHLPKVAGIPSPKDILGYHIGRPKTLTYYADALRYYRALEKAAPNKVKIETIGRSDEDRELVIVWISSEANMRNLDRNKANLKRIADPRGMSDADINQLIANTKPHYHLMGGLHSGEVGPSEMLMELAYRLVAETSPLINQIRENVYVSITPQADPDGRDRNVDWFYRNQEMAASGAPAPAGRGGGAGVPYWGKYVYHDNNRDINLSQKSMRAITDWYFTAKPPILHDLHESLPLLYTYSGGPPQNPNLDPVLFAELSFFANWELSQMTKWGMPGVYTHAFMDGWSPGYLGSVSYNHNGMMKMYETQSGSDFADSVANAPRTPAARADTADTSAAPAAAGRGGRGGRGGGGAGAAAPTGGRAGAPAGRTGGAAPVPTGRGGGQPREWYRGIPVPDSASVKFSRRNNANYMQTAVLSSLQLTSMFPNLVVQNFYIKTKNSMEAGRNAAPHGYIVPLQRDMTKVATLINVLRAQGIEVGTLNAPLTLDSVTYAAGSYVVKLDQPYGRLAKNLLEKQDYPDPALRTYDDSGWSMGFAFNVDVTEIRNKAVLDARTTPVTTATVKGTVAGSGNAALAVAHYGSNNMIAFRYKLRSVPMKVAEKAFTADGVTFPAGSFIITGSAADLATARREVESLGLTAAALSSVPTVATHDADVPRVAIYSQWQGTQELGWYRHAFDQFGIPFDLIYKERVVKGNLKADYDVIVMAAQNVTRAQVMAAPAARPQPYKRTDKLKFLGAYGETDDMTGGFGQAGVDAFEAFLEAGGTLITTLQAVRFPIEFGFARTVDTESPQGVNAQKPLVTAEIRKPDHPVFYGYEKTIFPMKFGQGQQVFRVGIADQDNVLAQFVGGESSVLSGLMVGADNIRGRAFAVDIPDAYRGKGRVLMFANNPIYRWQNHGEFNMVFNSIVNWNDVPAAPAPTIVP
ncbi:MAG TPA: M14 family zinc carboxypeptidase [Gemmatimonadaceae bacterium]